MQPWQHDDQVFQADGCGRSVSFQAALGFPYLLHQTSLGVSRSKGPQLQLWFPAVWSSSASTVFRLNGCHTVKSLLQDDLKIAFHPWVTKSVNLQLLRPGTFSLGRGLDDKGDLDRTSL